jgi:hypothetical protein
VFYELGVRHAVKPREHRPHVCAGPRPTSRLMSRNYALYPTLLGKNGAPTKVKVIIEQLSGRLRESKIKTDKDSPLPTS